MDWKFDGALPLNLLSLDNCALAVMPATRTFRFVDSLAFLFVSKDVADQIFPLPRETDPADVARDLFGVPGWDDDEQSFVQCLDAEASREVLDAKFSGIVKEARRWLLAQEIFDEVLKEIGPKELFRSLLGGSDLDDNHQFVCIDERNLAPIVVGWVTDVLKDVEVEVTARGAVELSCLGVPLRRG